MRKRISINQAKWLSLVLATMYIHTLAPARACTDERNTESTNPVTSITITQTSLKVTDQTLELHVQCANNLDDLRALRWK